MLLVRSDRVIAITAIYWSTFTGFERYFGVFATVGAYYWEHLAFGSETAASFVLLRLPGSAT